MEVQVEPQEQEQIRFGKLIADRLEKGRVDNDFERFVGVAAPAFLVQLRANFGAPLSSLVSLEVGKDIRRCAQKTCAPGCPSGR